MTKQRSNNKGSAKEIRKETIMLYSQNSRNAANDILVLPEILRYTNSGIINYENGKPVWIYQVDLVHTPTGVLVVGDCLSNWEEAYKNAERKLKEKLE
jgi:hypothetical protein